MTPTAPTPIPGGADTAAAPPRNRRGHQHLEVYGPAGRSPWLDIDWREHQRWITVDGQPVNTIELGEGPPLVFVHCLAGWWTNWVEQLPVFARERRVIAMDLPGFGHSPMPREPISASGYARLLDGLFNALGIDAAAVVGNSLGGFVSCELAIAFPERVERLVLVSAAGLNTFHNPETTRALALVRRFERAFAAISAWGAAHADAIARRRELRKTVLGSVLNHPGLMPAPQAAELIRGGGKPGFAGALETLITHSIRERMSEIACPTLIVWGERDRLVPVSDADVLAELIPNSRKVVFEDTSHLTMLERPDAFNALLRDFLRE
jgi:pimeloyl-ACP methyl ester carboxylesterase